MRMCHEDVSEGCVRGMCRDGRMVFLDKLYFYCCVASVCFLSNGAKGCIWRYCEEISPLPCIAWSEDAKASPFFVSSCVMLVLE